MGKTFSILILMAIVFFAVSSMAADKVVVIPLSTCADGLTDCSGKCVDTLNNPGFCGDCTTDCGAGNYCTNGLCKKVFSETCTENRGCLSGKCKNNVCTLSKTVFVTSDPYKGDLNGLFGADDICQASAVAAGLPGVYRAWLSDANISAADRISHSLYDYALVDGTVVAQGYLDLVDGELDHAINLDAYGQIIEFCVWTNTFINGISAKIYDDHCDSWEVDDNTEAGFVGTSAARNNLWTDFGASVICAAPCSLYCFEM